MELKDPPEKRRSKRSDLRDWEELRRVEDNLRAKLRENKDPWELEAKPGSR